MALFSSMMSILTLERDATAISSDLVESYSKSTAAQLSSASYYIEQDLLTLPQ
jgi:hypothetical protein